MRISNKFPGMLLLMVFLGAHSGNHHVRPCSSRRSPWTSSISVTKDPVRNTGSLFLPVPLDLRDKIFILLSDGPQHKWGRQLALDIEATVYKVRPGGSVPVKLASSQRSQRASVGMWFT